MRFIDLSQPLFDGAPNCPAHPRVKLRIAEHQGGGLESWQMEYFDFASHTGTHLDAPRHKIAAGACIDELDLEEFAGEAVIADLRHLRASAAIGPEQLQAALPLDVAGKIVLLCTGWTQHRGFNDQWLYQSPRLCHEGAEWLVRHGARAVGIDHFSVGGAQEPANAVTHQVLLGAGLWIVEELQFPPRVWQLAQPVRFMALPLLVRQGSGAPCRAVLLAPD